jgi:hypothetical protein
MPITAGMRIARIIAPDVVYHVISRFADHRWLITDDEERATYLRMFNRAVARSDWRWLGWAVMSNHIHHALVAGTWALERFLKSAHSPFARWMNERHARIGPVFADRPASWAIRPENVARVLAYIHNNPVRAGVVAHARDSEWTSHRAYLGLDAPPKRLDVALGLARCGMDADELDAFADADNTEHTRELSAFHRAARKYGALELGTPLAAPTVVPIVARPFARIRPAPKVVLDATARAIGLPPSTIASRSNVDKLRSARRLVIHVGVAAGVTISDMATVLGISRQSGSKHAKKPLSEMETAMVTVVLGELTKLPPSPGKRAEQIGFGPATG